VSRGTDRSVVAGSKEAKLRTCEGRLGYGVWCLGFRVNGVKREVEVWGMEFRVSSSGVGVSHVMFRVSGFVFRISDFRSRITGFRSRISGFGSRISGFGSRISGFGYRISGFGCRYLSDRGASERGDAALNGLDRLLFVEREQQRVPVRLPLPLLERLVFYLRILKYTR